MLNRLHELQRQVQERDETIRRLRGALAASMLPYAGHTTAVIDGVLTITLHTGAIYQRVQRLVQTETTTRYEWHFERAGTVPTSPAAMIAEALDETEQPREGMSVYEDDERVSA